MRFFLTKKHAPQTLPRRNTPQPLRAPVFSYYAKRSPGAETTNKRAMPGAVASDRAFSRLRRNWLRRFGVVFILAAIAMSLVPVLSLTPNAKVLPMDPSKTTFAHPLSTYQQAAQHLLDGSLLDRTKVTIDTNAIAAEMQHEYPELAAVSVALPIIGQRPIVYILPAQPMALYSSGGSSYLIDDAGKAIMQVNVPDTAEMYHVVPLQDASKQTVYLGQQVISSSTVTFIRKAIFQLAAKQLTATSFVLPAGKSELDMYVSGVSYFVKFNLADPSADEQIGSYFAVRNSLAEKGITPAAYIDVRIVGRAYYK